jgi:hypothetical protein
MMMARASDMELCQAIQPRKVTAGERASTTGTRHLEVWEENQVCELGRGDASGKTWRDCIILTRSPSCPSSSSIRELIYLTHSYALLFCS